MDSFTHLLTGLAIGQAFSDGKDRHKPLVWGAIAGNIPDFDVMFQLLVSPENSMLFHRGLSHSLLLWALSSPLLALVINKIFRGNSRSYLKWLCITATAWFSHIFLDIFNTYGTGIFEPFSQARIAYDAVNVIDILYFVPVLIMSVFFVFIIKNCLKKRITALTSLIYSLTYILASVLIKINIETTAETLLVKKGISPSRIISSPLPLSTLAWKIVAETDAGFHTGTFYGFWKKDATFDILPKNKCLEKEFEQYDGFRKLKQFTKNCYVIDRTDNGQTVLCDLRFTSLSPSGDALCFPLKIDENTLKIGRASPNRHINFNNIRDYYRRLVH
jgi:inner membrane protein